MVATNIREEARNSLKGKWLKAIIMLFLEVIIVGIASAISEAIKDNSIIKPIFAIIEIIIQIPLTYGLIHSFIKLKRNEEVNYFDFIKIGFANFSRSWKICFRTILKMIVPILCIIGAIVLFSVMLISGGVTGITFNVGQQALGLIIFAIIIYVAAIAYAVIIGLKYALTIYIAYDNQDMSAKELVEKSEDLMIGHRGDLFVLVLSFLGWAILCYVPLGLAIANVGLFRFSLAIIFGICAVVAMLALGAYVAMARVCFYDDILKLNSEKSTEVQ